MTIYQSYYTFSTEPKYITINSMADYCQIYQGA